MAETRDDRAVAELIADFGGRVEEMRREGVPIFPPLEGRMAWDEVAEPRKHAAIVGESTQVWLDPGAVGPEVIAVPGAAALEMVERLVDYAELPAAQRVMLEDLRARLDAGQHGGGVDAGGKDSVAMALARVVGVGQLDDMLHAAKEDEDRPWAEVPEAGKVRVIVDAAQEAGPPGAYTLAAIEREVDYERLPFWRREALEGLRTRLDRGELDGENPNPRYQGDRAELALRLAELEARIEDGKQFDGSTIGGHHWAWRQLREEQKLDQIEWEIYELHLDSEAAAYAVVTREVDRTQLPEETGQEFEGSRAHGDDPDDGDRNPPGGAAPAQQSPDKPAASDYARTLDDTARRAQQRDPDRGIDR